MELFSPGHLIPLLIIAAILFFGWKQLPDMARSVGRSLRIFKTEMKGMTDDDKAREEALGASESPPPAGTANPPVLPSAGPPAVLEAPAPTAAPGPPPAPPPSTLAPTAEPEPTAPLAARADQPNTSDSGQSGLRAR